MRPVLSSSTLISLIVLLCPNSHAATQTSPQAPPSNDHVPIYRVTVVQRALDAINFQRHTGPTQIDLKGTVLLPKAEGRATVEVKNGYTKIDLSVRKVGPPTIFGNEFLTYVLWAITPEGKAVNLGELIPDGSDKASMHITSPYSTFGLLATAEPYFAVPYPSDVVILESAVRPDTIGQAEEVRAKYQLLPRGQYTLNIQASRLASADMKNQPGVSMDQYEAISTLYQARNAVQIAGADGASKGAADTLAKAQNYLAQAEAAYAQKDYKGTTNAARQAVEAASDARTIGMREAQAPGSHQ
jgi:hypothetical protein